MDTRLILTVIALFGIGGALMALAGRNAGPRRDWTKYVVYAAVILCLLVLARVGRPWLAVLLIAIAARCTIELRYAFGHRLSPAGTAAIFGLLLLSFGHLFWGESQTWFASFALVLILVATTDSFSQLSGRLLGRRLLCPRISPGKTVEGLVGGFLAVLVVSAALAFLSPEWTLLRRTTLAMVTAVGATLGDLVFSAIKRRTGIKNFAVVLPGHGGALDRFDSLIIAAPLHVWTRMLLAP